MRVKGVYTVEAVFVVSISIWILVALCYGGMYVHDRVVMEAVTNEEAAAWLSSGEKSPEEWRGDLKQELDHVLFLLVIHSIETKEQFRSQKICVKYSVPVSWTLLKKLWSGGRELVVYQTEREDINPAKDKWDALILGKKEEEG